MIYFRNTLNVRIILQIAGLSTLSDNTGDSRFWTVSPSLQIRDWNLRDKYPFLLCFDTRLLCYMLSMHCLCSIYIDRSQHYFCINDVVWCHHKWRHAFWRYLLSLPCQFSIFEDLSSSQPWIGLNFVVVLVLAKNTTSQRQRGLPVYRWPLVLD